MSEDIKKEELAAEGGETTPLEEETAAESGENTQLDEDIADELEQLRDTFQEKYDETAAEAVIQELEDAADEPEDEDEADIAEEAPAAAPEKKKKRKSVKIAIIIVAVVLVLIFGALIAYFVASVSNPNFNALITSMSKASSAESYSERMSAYEEALGYCDGESKMQAAMRSVILDGMLEASYKEKGFDAAYTLMKENLSEEEIDASSSKTVKTIKKVTAAAGEIAGGSFDAAAVAYAEDSSVTADKIASQFTIPTEIKEDIISAFENELKALDALHSASGMEAAADATEYLSAAYSLFTGAGADDQDLAEKMSVSLYKNGYVLSAVTMASSLVSPDAEPINQEFADMKAEFADFADMEISIYALAEKAVKAGTDDCAKVVAENCELTGAKASVAADLVAFCADGIKAEKEKNISRAVSAYANTMGVADTLGIKDAKIIYKTVSLMVKSGNFADLQSYDAYLTEEVTAALTETEKADVQRIHSIYNALQLASEVFSEYYMNYAYYGTAIDYEAACADLDATLTDSSTKYDKGFVAYCKYFAAMYSDNKQDFEKYIDEMKKQMPELKPVYGYYLIDLYKAEKNFDKALAAANEILAENIGDDYANSMVAFAKRTAGDVDGALEIALKGIELSGVDGYCLTEAGINYMVKGDYDNAFTYVKKMYETTRTLESCELILICSALYNGSDTAVKDELAALAAEVNELYSNYGAKSYTDTQAVISGEKTLADVYLSGEYTLQDTAVPAEETTAAAE